MTDGDTNEETARRPPKMLYQRSELGFEWGATHSAETLIWLGAITTRCEDRSSSNGKLYFASLSSICSR
jgi:hypothetical protein